MTEIGSVSNKMAIEYNTKVFLFKNPKADFNEFWKDRFSHIPGKSQTV